MTTSEVPPEGTSEVPPKGKSRLDRSIVFGILSIALGLATAVLGIRVYGYTSFSRGYEITPPDTLLCGSPFAVGLLTGGGVLLALAAWVEGRKRKSWPGRLLSAAGLALNIIACLVYSLSWLMLLTDVWV
jgi:hypothetical protein